jgi:hypothetical protein
MRNVRQLAPLTLALGVAFGASAQTPPPDPVFAHSYESGVLSLAPNLGYIAEGASGVSSAPTPLTVTLSAPAASATFVPIVSPIRRACRSSAGAPRWRSARPAR